MMSRSSSNGAGSSVFKHAQCPIGFPLRRRLYTNGGMASGVQALGAGSGLLDPSVCGRRRGELLWELLLPSVWLPRWFEVRRLRTHSNPSSC